MAPGEEQTDKEHLPQQTLFEPGKSLEAVYITISLDWEMLLQPVQSYCTMEHCIFAFSLIIEGTAEKVLQLIMPLKSI